MPAITAESDVEPEELHLKFIGKLRAVWWWPAIISVYCLLGLYVLYAYSGEIFEFMSPETAQMYIVIVSTFLIILYILSVVITAIRFLHRRRLRKAEGVTVDQ